MEIKTNHPLYQRLTDNYTTRASIDDPNLKPHQIFQLIVLSFNNNDLKIMLPHYAYDVQWIDDINANDESRVMITRLLVYRIYIFICLIC